MDRYSFSGKHVLVTGASGGLGSAMVRNLADMGARMVITSRSMNALDELVGTLPKGTSAIPITADLSRSGDAANLARDALEAMGYIDVLVNNAGVGYFALIEEATEENIRHLFELNTFSPLILIKTLLPQMRARGSGRVVNIVSAAGRVPIPTVGVYGGSKSALAVMTNTMRLELEPSGIEVINIYPGTAATSFEENALREEERPGLCPMDSCGLPRFDMAEKVLDAASGPPGEVWLEWQGKWMAVAALAWPGIIERGLTPLRDRAVKNKSLKKRRWRLLQVESSIACNLRCIMCPWRDIAKGAENRGIMTQEVWEALRPHLSEADSIDFTGGGEPLLQPRIVEWITEAHRAGCDTGILTNGLLLKMETARELIAAGIDWICVSMDGTTKERYEEIRVGSDFEQVCQNLEGVSRMRRGRIPKTMINFVLMSKNFDQVEEIVKLASRLGVDQVNFKQCDVIRGESGKGFGLFGKKETREIHRLQKALSKARLLAKKLDIETTAFAFTPTERPVCEQDPRDSMFIRHDGSVGPCINLAIGGPTTFLGEEVILPTVHYGRLPDGNIPDLWDTESCRFYRQRFESRVNAHEDTLVQALVGSSSGREKALRDALKAMPEAPEGCRTCHYLYDV